MKYYTALWCGRVDTITDLRRSLLAAQICRLANDVYRSYNRHQSPFLVLAITLSREQVDVNVTPDKRLLFVQNEKHLLACIKVS